VNGRTENRRRNGVFTKLPPNIQSHFPSIRLEADIDVGRLMKTLKHTVARVAEETLFHPTANRNDMKMQRVSGDMPVASDMKMLRL
jgi:hypothetical protein